MPIEYEVCSGCPNAGSCEDYEPDHPHRCRSVSCDACGDDEDDTYAMYEISDGAVVCSNCLFDYLIKQHIIRPSIKACTHPDECLDCPSDGSDTLRRWYVTPTKERVCDEALMDYLEDTGVIKSI